MSVPYRFSWFVEGKVAGMAWPDSETMEYLSQQGIKVLVNLTGEPSVYERTAKDYGIECLTISIADFCPPTVLQVNNIIMLFLVILDPLYIVSSPYNPIEINAGRALLPV